MAQLYQNLSHKGEAEFASPSTTGQNAAETAAPHAVFHILSMIDGMNIASIFETAQYWRPRFFSDAPKW